MPILQRVQRALPAKAAAESGYRVSDNYKYDAYGIKIESTGTNEIDAYFSNQEWDRSLNLSYLRSRYLSNESGRFLTGDSFEGFNQDPNSFHKYTFVQSQPVNTVDPSGHMGIGTASDSGFALTGRAFIEAIKSANYTTIMKVIGTATIVVAAGVAVEDSLTGDLDSDQALGLSSEFSSLVQLMPSFSDDFWLAHRVMTNWIAKAVQKNRNPNLKLVIPLPTLNPFPKIEPTRKYKKVREGVYTMTGGPGGRILGAFFTAQEPVDGEKITNKIDIGQAHYHAMPAEYPGWPYTIHLHPGSNYRIHLMLVPGPPQFRIFGKNPVDRDLTEGDLE